MKMRFKRHYEVTTPSKHLPNFCVNNWERGDIIPVSEDVSDTSWPSAKAYIKARGKQRGVIKKLHNGLVINTGCHYGLCEIHTITIEDDFDSAAEFVANTCETLLST